VPPAFAGAGSGAAGRALAPLYPKGERGRPPIGLERMLRVYFVPQWYGLSDEGLEDAFYDSHALRGFAGIALNRDPVPDATTVLHFRHWLERHDLTKGLFEEVSAILEERGLLMRQSLPRRRPGDDCRCDDNCRAILDQEPAAEPRPGDASTFPRDSGHGVIRFSALPALG